jgi:hypothetical protein
VRDHQQRCQFHHQIFEVDETSFSSFVRHMNWRPRPTWQPCQPLRVGNRRRESPQLPEPLPVPENYRIPRVRPPSTQPPPSNPEPSSPPRPVRTSTPSGSPDQQEEIRGVNFLPPLRPIQARLGPFSATIPHTFERMRRDLDSYEDTIHREIRRVRREQLSYSRCSREYQRYGNELDALYDAASAVRRASRLLVAPGQLMGRRV